MSYASLVKTLPETLGSSTSLAFIASLGIHGLLWAVLPVLDFESKSVESLSQRTIGLVELTPAEQSRLPQGFTPEVTLPPFAMQDSVLPPLPPPPPSFPVTLPPLPSFNVLPPSSTPISKYPLRAASPQTKTFQARTAPPSQKNQAFNPQTFRVQTATPNQQRQFFNPQVSFKKLPAQAPIPIYKPQQLPPPPPFVQPGNSGLPSTSGLKPAPLPFSPTDISPSLSSIAKESPNPRNPNQQQSQEIAKANLQPNQPARITKTENLPERNREELVAALQEKLQEKPVRNPVNSTPQPVRAANPEVKSPVPSPKTENLPERNREELVAALQEKLQEKPVRNPVNSTPQPVRAANPEVKSPVPSPKTENPPERNREELVAALQQRVQPQPESKPASSVSVETAQAIRQLDEYKARHEEVQEEHPKVETKAPIREKITTCEKQLDGSFAYIGAVVNPQGKLMSGPDLIDKTGAADVEQAQAFVKNYPFKATGNPTNYNFTIEFEYGTGKCSEPTPEASPENTETEQSKP